MKSNTNVAPQMQQINATWVKSTPSTMSNPFEEEMSKEMVRAIQEEIDREVVRSLIKQQEMEEYYQNRDAKLREANPALQQAWDDYQVMIRLLKEGVNT